MKYLLKFYFFSVIIFSFLFIFPAIAQTSTEIYFKNENNQILNGDTFLIDLKISSDRSINVIDGTILFDKDKLEIKNINKENSIFSMWANEPVFDNDVGSISFIGGIPNGFKDDGGQVLGINFSAKKSGEAIVHFQDIFKVYLNDGLATEINPWLKPLKISIKKKDYLENISKYVFVMNQNYIYYISLCILVILFIIIRVSLKFKNKKNNPLIKKKDDYYK